jgi:choline kinase
MQAVILAAGVGLRLGMGEPRPPKCLLRFDERTLMERHLSNLGDLGVSRVHLGLGYRAECIYEELARIGIPLPVNTVFNPDYEQGNVVTLHCMEQALCAGDDVLLMDADVLYDPAILARLADSAHENSLLLDRDFAPGPEPVKLCLRDGRPVGFSKQPPPQLDFDTVGESVGFFKLGGTMARELWLQAQRYLARGEREAYYEDALRDLLLRDPDAFGVVDVTGQAWIEIDFPHDIERARSEVLPRISARDAA